MPLRTGAMALLAISGLSLAASTLDARASVVQYTYTGVVGYGYDRAGIFGATEDITGETFSLVERFNTDNAAYRWVGSAGSMQFGGSDRGAARSASLTVTIGGVSRSIADLEDYIYSGQDTGKHLDFVKDASGYEYAGFYVESSRMAPDYASAMTLDAADALFIGSYQFFSSTDPALATYASFDVRSLTVGLVSAVPLPGGLALFGASLLVLGIGARFRGRFGKAGDAVR